MSVPLQHNQLYITIHQIVKPKGLHGMETHTPMCTLLAQINLNTHHI